MFERLGQSRLPFTIAILNMTRSDFFFLSVSFSSRKRRKGLGSYELKTHELATGRTRFFKRANLRAKREDLKREPCEACLDRPADTVGALLRGSPVSAGRPGQRAHGDSGLRSRRVRHLGLSRECVTVRDGRQVR